MNTLGLVNVLNNDGNVLIDVAQMADNHIQNAAIHNALAEWNETDDPFSPETTQRLIGKLKGEMPSLIAWLSEGNYPKSSLVPELLAYVKMPHPLQVYKNLDLDITIEDSEKGPAFDVKLSYAGNAEHFKYAHLPVETDKTSVVLSIIDAHDDLQLKNDPEHPGYRETVETNYSKLTDLIGKDGIDSIRDFHEGVETGKYFSDMEFDLKDPDPSAKHILECLGSLDKPVQKAMDNFARVTTFRNLAKKNLLREATLFTSGVLEEKNGRLIVPQGYRPGMSREEYQAWHPSARGNTAISVDTAISAKQLGKHGWQFIFDFIDAPIDLSYVRQVHQLVSNNLVPDSGQLRYFDVYIGGTSWQPEIPDFDTAKAAIEKIANMEPGRERALKMFGYLCRSQLFSDGNKRTAQLIANKMLIADGCGILAIPKEQINNFETLLLDFYETNKPDKFFSFLTKEAIYGLDRTVPSSQNLKVKCKAATLGSNALKTRSNTVGISKTQNADRTAHTEHIE